MNLYEAIPQRFSCRAFSDAGVGEDVLDALREELERANDVDGLSFQLFGPGEGNLQLKRQMFATQAPCYLALVGTDDALGKELVGYYGERLVLLATALGLGTCWVAGTFDRTSVVAEIGAGQALHDVIPFGRMPEKLPLKQRTIRAGLRKRDRKLGSYLPDADFDSAPDWVHEGVKAVAAGPSAVNGQPVVFGWDGSSLTARLTKHKLGLEETDLGIAKLHFELAATAAGHPGAWEWGERGAYR